jgi:SAM-dependent methyltransferase
MGESFDPQNSSEFDRYAQSYDALHAASISASGESTEYFAIYKRKVLERLLGKGFDRAVLDFGCGIGNLTSILGGSFPTVHGYDPSSASADIAKTRAPKSTFFDNPEELPKDFYGAVVLANVLHHVPPANRPGLLNTIYEVLGPGGRLVIFEHNPYNPLTRRAVAACPFDDGVELLHPGEAKRLLKKARLSAVELDFIVFFPKALSVMRPLEPRLAWVPLGAQFCAWGFK